MQAHEEFPGNKELRMTWYEWMQYRLDPMELILNCSAVDGSDFHQAHPIGMAVFIVPAMPADPRDFDPRPVHNWASASRPIANAIFRTDTTHVYGGRLRDKAAQQLAAKDFIFKDIRSDKSRLSPEDTMLWYKRTPFTISPRGAGFDCHRTYEALICKSLPIVMGADESLRLKYFKLPVFFVDSYENLSIGRLAEWYEEAGNKVYDFNFLTKSYWQHRRPDVDLTMQSVFWLKRYGVFDNVKLYFKDSEQATIKRTNPRRHR